MFAGSLAANLSAVSGYCWTRDLDGLARCGLAALAALDSGSPAPVEKQQMSHFTTSRRADGVASGRIAPISKDRLWKERDSVGASAQLRISGRNQVNGLA